MAYFGTFLLCQTLPFQISRIPNFPSGYPQCTTHMHHNLPAVYASSKNNKSDTWVCGQEAQGDQTIFHTNSSKIAAVTPMQTCGPRMPTPPNHTTATAIVCVFTSTHGVCIYEDAVYSWHPPSRSACCVHADLISVLAPTSSPCSWPLCVQDLACLLVAPVLTTSQSPCTLVKAHPNAMVTHDGRLPVAG